MRERLRRLTDFQEALIVIVLALGLFVYYSLRGLIIITTDISKNLTYSRTEKGGISILVIEVISLGLIAYFLRERNWKLRDLNLTISFKVVFQALLLFFITFLVAGLAYRFATIGFQVESELGPVVTTVRHKNYLIWGLLLVINSFFEEFVYAGYLFRKLENHNRGLFILLSSTLRTIIHLYQGWLAIVPHFIMGVLFGAYYTKYRQLTTLIIAHGLWNLFVLWRAG